MNTHLSTHHHAAMKKYGVQHKMKTVTKMINKQYLEIDEQGKI